MKYFKSSYIVPFSKDEIWEWLSRAGTFERLSPPWVNMEILHKDSSLSVGSKVDLLIHFGIFKIEWFLEHVDMKAYEFFNDQQIKGPFNSWLHHHSFESTLNGQCQLDDEIHYDGAIAFFLNPFIKRELKRLFHFRKNIICTDLAVRHTHKNEHIQVHLLGSWNEISKPFTSLIHSFGGSISTSPLIINFDDQKREIFIDDRFHDRKVTLKIPTIISSHFPLNPPSFWITRDDVLYSIYHSLIDVKIKGFYEIGFGKHTFPYPLSYQDYFEAKKRLLGLW